MKRLIPFTVLGVLLSGCLYAQLQTASAKRPESTDVYRIKEGSDLSKALSYSDRFQFEHFKDGVAYLRNGKTIKTRFNYSLVHGEVMFISPLRDTMLLSDPEFVDCVTIGDHVFYFQKGRGHFEVVSDYGKVSLCKKPYLARIGNERYASYDQYSSASSISSFSTYSNGNGELKFLEGRDKIIFKRRAALLFVDKNHRVYPASRASLARIFRADKSKINAFVRENLIDFEKEDDVEKTLSFCSTL